MFDLDMHRLVVFYTVVNEGTLSKAGDKLFMSQPAISAHIKALEGQLGMPLFYRVGRRSVVNKAGEVLYKKAEELFNVAEDLKTEMDNLKGMSIGRLALGGSVDWQYRLPRLLDGFKQKYPGVEVSLEIGNSSRIEKLVADRSLDIGFIARPTARDDMRSEHLADDALVAICNPSHRFAHMPEVPLEELSDESFIVREHGSAARAMTDGVLGANDLLDNVSMELGSYEAIKSAVMSGKGIGLISNQSLGVEVQAERLAIADIPSLRSRLELHVLHLVQKKLTLTQQTFIATVFADDEYSHRFDHESENAEA